MAEQLTEQIVSPELAFELKQKGFDSVCMAYRWDKTWKHLEGVKQNTETLTYSPLSHRDHNELPTRVSAPFYFQVIDWFWDKHNIFIRFEVASEYQIYWEVEQYSTQKIDNPKGAEINKLTAKQKAIEHALTLI